MSLEHLNDIYMNKKDVWRSLINTISKLSYHDILIQTCAYGKKADTPPSLIKGMPFYVFLRYLKEPEKKVFKAIAARSFSSVIIVGSSDRGFIYYSYKDRPPVRPLDPHVFVSSYGKPSWIIIFLTNPDGCPYPSRNEVLDALVFCYFMWRFFNISPLCAFCKCTKRFNEVVATLIQFKKMEEIKWRKPAPGIKWLEEYADIISLLTPMFAVGEYDNVMSSICDYVTPIVERRFIRRKRVLWFRARENVNPASANWYIASAILTLGTVLTTGEKAIADRVYFLIMTEKSLRKMKEVA